MPHRISFIVPTFNRAPFLGQALSAILAQVGAQDEVLVIDDGSTDGTAGVVEGFGPRVRYVHQENSGKSAALNRAMEQTDGELVWICDDDDLLLPGAVATLAAALEDPAVDFAFGRYYPFRNDPAGTMERLPFHWPDLGHGSIARHLLEDSFIMQNAALVRRSLHHAVGPFDTAMLRSLDYEMFVRLALCGRPLFVDREIFAQRKHEGARGPAAMRHAVNASESVWLEFDRRIFRKLNGEGPISIYEAMFRGEDAGLVARAAFLQRACVNVRHGLWELAVADIQAAAARAGERELEPVERQVCARMLCGKYDLANMTDKAVLAPLRSLYAGGGVAREAVLAMVAGGLWRFRRREGGDVADMLRVIAGTVGPAGIPALLGARKKGGAGPSTVEELDELSRTLSPEELPGRPA